MRLRDIVCAPDGSLSESKVWANVFKLAMTYVFLAHSAEILKDWTVLSVFVAGVIAPDILKKFLTIRAGGRTK